MVYCGRDLGELSKPTTPRGLTQFPMSGKLRNVDRLTWCWLGLEVVSQTHLKAGCILAPAAHETMGQQGCPTLGTTDIQIGSGSDSAGERPGKGSVTFCCPWHGCFSSQNAFRPFPAGVGVGGGTGMCPQTFPAKKLRLSNGLEFATCQLVCGAG